jgi:hypothetical protein
MAFIINILFDLCISQKPLPNNGVIPKKGYCISYTMLSSKLTTIKARVYFLYYFFNNRIKSNYLTTFLVTVPALVFIFNI